MDDPRVSRMYIAIVRRWFSLDGRSTWRRSLMRSGMVTGLILAALVVVLLVAYRERGRGHLHRLEEKITTERKDAPVPRPGGQQAIVLTRTQLAGGSAPEFLSVTMLPGRGMNVLQIVAYIPDRGEVKLLASPEIEGAEQAMTGVDADANGRQSLEMGGAFEAPWAGRIWGTPAQGRVASSWRGHAVILPAETAGSATALGGSMLAEPAEATDTAALPDGGQAYGSFAGGDFGARWPSTTEIKVTALLTSQSVEFTVVAHNMGDVAEPVGIGWHPRFAIAAGRREQMRLHVPGQARVEVRGRQSGTPTGLLLQVSGTPYDFTGRSGVELGKIDLDDSFTHLHQEFLDNGPVAELDDPADNYGLRMTALSSAVRTMRVVAPVGADYISIDPQYNYPDPFGKEWGKDVDTGMVVLQPGQTTQWKVRLELIALSGVQAWTQPSGVTRSR